MAPVPFHWNFQEDDFWKAYFTIDNQQVWKNKSFADRVLDRVFTNTRKKYHLDVVFEGRLDGLSELLPTFITTKPPRRHWQLEFYQVDVDFASTFAASASKHAKYAYRGEQSPWNIEPQHESALFATLIQIVKDFIKQNDPLTITFRRVSWNFPPFYVPCFCDRLIQGITVSGYKNIVKPSGVYHIVKTTVGLKEEATPKEYRVPPTYPPSE